MGEIGLKTKYFGSVWEVFILCPFTRYKLRLKIFQMKDLIKIHTRGECHRYSIWLWCYKSSTFFIAIQYPWNMKWPPFGFFWGPYSPKYCSILLKFWPEVFSNDTNTVFEKSFRTLHFWSNGTHPKFTVLVHFGAQCTAGKPKILLKNQNFCNFCILRNIK